MVVEGAVASGGVRESWLRRGERKMVVVSSGFLRRWWFYKAALFCFDFIL